MEVVGEFLQRSAAMFTAVPFEAQLAGHCLMIAYICKGKYEKRYMMNSLAGFTMAFGGGCITSFLLQVRGSEGLGEGCHSWGREAGAGSF